MVELDSENRLSGRLEEASDGVVSNVGSVPVRDPMVPADSLEVVGAGQNKVDLPGIELVISIRERLEEHPQFRGRASLLKIELIDETIVLSGCLPSHYLKQLLQEAIRLIPDVGDIDNRVSVMRPDE